MAVIVYSSLDFSNILVDVVKSGLNITSGFDYTSVSTLFVKNIYMLLNMSDVVSSTWSNKDFKCLNIVDTSTMYARSNVFAAASESNIKLIDPRSRLILRICPKK